MTATRTSAARQMPVRLVIANHPRTDPSSLGNDSDAHVRKLTADSRAFTLINYQRQYLNHRTVNNPRNQQNLWHSRR